ncbi:hypothetical protein ACS0TY_013911 [Phlomoides rotata]
MQVLFGALFNFDRILTKYGNSETMQHIIRRLKFQGLEYALTKKPERYDLLVAKSLSPSPSRSASARRLPSLCRQPPKHVARSAVLSAVLSPKHVARSAVLSAIVLQPTTNQRFQPG